MKTFKSFFAFFLVSILVLSVNSCKKENSEELGSFQGVLEKDVQVFKDLINAQGEGVQIVDFRSADDFAAGHIPGAINIPATYQNTQSNNSFFCEEILRLLDKTKPVFLYGKKTDISLGKIVAGRVSKIGFEHARTCFFEGGFEAWKAAFPDEVER